MRQSAGKQLRRIFLLFYYGIQYSTVFLIVNFLELQVYNLSFRFCHTNMRSYSVHISFKILLHKQHDFFIFYSYTITIDEGNITDRKQNLLPRLCNT